MCENEELTFPFIFFPCSLSAGQLKSFLLEQEDSIKVNKIVHTAACLLVGNKNLHIIVCTTILREWDVLVIESTYEP